MARDAFWFPHDSNCRDDPRCCLLIEQLGLEGYGIYWVLVETLRDQPGYRYPLALLPMLARRYCTTLEKMRVVVNNYSLFVIYDSEFFLSPDLSEKMQPWDFKREINRLKGLKSGERRRLQVGCSAKVEQRLNTGSTAVEQKQNITNIKNKETNQTEETAERLSDKLRCRIAQREQLAGRN